jgi:ferredoxin
MADKDSKAPNNVPGAWYVDDQCTACNLCVDTSPANFKLDEGEAFAYVCKQPENEEEEKGCQEAKESCPSESIGSDG